MRRTRYFPSQSALPYRPLSLVSLHLRFLKIIADELNVAFCCSASAQRINADNHRQLTNRQSVEVIWRTGGGCVFDLHFIAAGFFAVNAINGSGPSNPLFPCRHVPCGSNNVIVTSAFDPMLFAQDRAPTIALNELQIALRPNRPSD